MCVKLCSELASTSEVAEQCQHVCSWRITREKVNDMAPAAGWVAGNCLYIEE